MSQLATSRHNGLSLLLLCSALAFGCVAEEAGDGLEDDPYNSDVAPGAETEDAAASLTGFIVVGEDESLPRGKAAVYSVDGLQIAEIDVDEYLALAEQGEGTLFASPVFSPAEGRDITSDEQDSFRSAKPKGGDDSSDEAVPTGELNPYHCNASGVLRPIPGLPPCDAYARWVTPRVFSGPPKRYAYLLYRLEHVFGDEDDEYPHAKRTWWGWGDTVEVHKATVLWSLDDGKLNKTDITVPVGAKFDYQNPSTLVEATPFERDGHRLRPIFLQLPLVFTDK